MAGTVIGLVQGNPGICVFVGVVVMFDKCLSGVWNFNNFNPVVANNLQLQHEFAFPVLGVSPYS